MNANSSNVHTPESKHNHSFCVKDKMYFCRIREVFAKDSQMCKFQKQFYCVQYEVMWDCARIPKYRYAQTI